MSIESALGDEIRIYWKPGCSNCVRLKEYVSKRGFDFTPVNVVEDPDAVSVLESLGIRGLPVITRGVRHAYGLDLSVVDDILGSSSERASLGVAEMIARAVAIVDAALRFGRQLPRPRYHDALPGRPQRSYFMLVNHVVGHLRRLVLVAENPGTDYSDVAVYAAAGYQVGTEDLVEPGLSVDDIAQRADDLKGRALAWLDTDDDPDRSVEVFYGTVPLRQVIESNTYSIAQHTRQLQAVITFLGLRPDGPIGPQQYDGLNLPEALWDEVP